MACIAKPRELRIHLRHHREGGITPVRLLAGRSSYSGAPWWQVRVGSFDPIVFATLEEAEAAFAIIAGGGSIGRINQVP